VLGIKGVDQEFLDAAEQVARGHSTHAYNTRWNGKRAVSTTFSRGTTGYRKIGFLLGFAGARAFFARCFQGFSAQPEPVEGSTGAFRHRNQLVKAFLDCPKSRSHFGRDAAGASFSIGGLRFGALQLRAVSRGIRTDDQSTPGSEPNHRVLGTKQICAVSIAVHVGQDVHPFNPVGGNMIKEEVIANGYTGVEQLECEARHRCPHIRKARSQDCPTVVKIGPPYRWYATYGDHLLEPVVIDEGVDDCGLESPGPEKA
jgi:hypothetical protein